MTYAQPFIRFTFGGSLADDQEIWSCNFHVADPTGASTPTDLAAAAADSVQAVAGRLMAFVESGDVMVPQGVQLEYVNYAIVGTDGKTVGDIAGVTAVAQGSSQGSYIPQAALVSTFVSDKFRDPGKYNRFYLPITLGVTSGNQYWLTTAQQTAYANEVASLIEDVNSFFTETETYDLVWSVVSNAGAGSSLPASAVKVGRVIDTQRRRRNSLSEAYVSVPVTTNP